MSAQVRSGIVSINIRRTYDDSNEAQTYNDAASVIGKLKKGYWPSHNYVQYIGTQGSAWLLFEVFTTGEIGIFHQYNSNILHWSYFEGSLSYPIA